MAKLLVVDDEVAMRRLVRLNLADDYEIIDTGEPEHALALALEHKPDAILLDLRMPKYSGFELCQMFTTFGATQLIPVVVISGEAGSKTKEICRGLGVVGYFEKPVDFDALRARLGDFLKSRRQERRSESRVKLRVPLKLHRIPFPGPMSAYALNAKPYKGWGMEGAVARWYTALTKKSLEDFKALARRSAEQILPQSRVLEVAPGPGYFAIELAKLGDYQISGLDIGETFVEIARANAAKANVRIDFRRGNASGMPFGDDTFDFLLCRAAFKNFSEPQRALEEMYRVLGPGGQALIIDLRRDASKESINQAIDDMNLNTINGIITRLTFRFMLLKRAYTKREFEELISQTKFRHAAIRENLIGLEILLSKDRATS